MISTQSSHFLSLHLNIAYAPGLNEASYVVALESESCMIMGRVIHVGENRKMARLAVEVSPGATQPEKLPRAWKPWWLQSGEPEFLPVALFNPGPGLR